MRRIPTDEIQPLLLEVLTAFDAWCGEHGLRYFMDYGTLLGAARHKGFIPWDDDVDVSMMRQDYLRLLELARSNPYLDDKRRYRILLPGELPNFYPFVKVIDESTLAYERNVKREYALGLWLDVFCMVPLPEDERAVERLFSRHIRYKEINKLVVCGNIVDDAYRRIYPFARIAGAVLEGLGMGPGYWTEKMVALLDEGSESGTRVGQLSWASKMEINCTEAAWWDKAVRLDFEGRQLVAPADYDLILRRHYGNYMELPPEKDRVRHDFEAYYLD